MGLVSAELVASLEEEFGIEIGGDEKVACTPTARGVTDLVLGKLSTADEAENAKRRSFYAVRDALKKLYQKPGRVRLSTDLVSFLPWSVRSKAWSLLEKDLGEALPPLRRPRELWIIGLWVCPTIGFAFGMLQESILIGVVMTVLPILALWFLTAPFARDFPEGVSRVGDLASAVAARVREPVPPHGWTRDEVAKTVRSLIAVQAGVLEFDDDAHLVDDLCLD